jgi:release factor glutamine methyltransferase
MQSIKRVQFSKYSFDVWENVYEPAEDSFLFAENLAVPLGAQVLDVGTGCGLLAILAAAKGANVLALDSNPFAVRCAKHNSRLNDLGNKIGFLQADLFMAFKETALFDLITFNAPYLPAPIEEEDSWIGRSWAGGIDGRKVIDRFISQAPLHLKHEGRILLMQSTLANENQTIKKFSEHRLLASVIAQCNLPFFETLTLIQAKA